MKSFQNITRGSRLEAPCVKSMLKKLQWANHTAKREDYFILNTHLFRKLASGGWKSEVNNFHVFDRELYKFALLLSHLHTG